MLHALTKGFVPKTWSDEYRVSKSISISQWIADLSSRVKFLGKYRDVASSSTKMSIVESVAGPYWLGGLFSPEAFITATRQLVAQVRKRNL